MLLILLTILMIFDVINNITNIRNVHGGAHSLTLHYGVDGSTQGIVVVYSPISSVNLGQSRSQSLCYPCSEERDASCRIPVFKSVSRDIFGKTYRIASRNTT